MLQRFTRSVLVVALLVPGSFIVQGLLPGSSAWASPRVAAPDPAAPVPAPPSLTSINPASATVGAAQFTLTLTGTGFLAAAVASFGKSRSDKYPVLTFELSTRASEHKRRSASCSLAISSEKIAMPYPANAA